MIASCSGSGSDAVEKLEVAEPVPSVVPLSNLDFDLEDRLRIWKRQKLANYEMTLDCVFGNGIGGPATPVVIRVSGGTARSIKASREVDTRPTDAYKKFDTVEKMFDYIQEIRDRSLNADGTRKSTPTVNASFNELGHPDEIRIVWDNAADAFTTCKVTQLKPLT